MSKPSCLCSDCELGPCCTNTFPACVGIEVTPEEEAEMDAPLSENQD